MVIKMNELQKLIDDSEYIVFFGGAGVSTESGIPDFRSVDGLYNQKYKFPPETILSHDFFVRHTSDFYEFYRDKMLCLDAEPNITHLKLAELEKSGKLKAVITQNIDGLHQKAGSKQVYELHGSVLRNYCRKCGKFYDAEYILESADIPLCSCGGTIKPDVVLYQEGLDDNTVSGAVSAITQADLIIVGGTSLNVYPAAGFLRYRSKECKLVLVNKSETPFDDSADLVIHDSLGKIFSQIQTGETKA